MGLDMYLTKKISIGAFYNHLEIEGSIEITAKGIPVKIDFSKIEEITERVGQWRKANHVHQWFVQNVQSGTDNCREYSVLYSELTTLKNLCIKALETKDSTGLPRAEGFFFGSVEIDEGYFEDLKHTVEIISKLDPKGEYYYRSCW